MPQSKLAFKNNQSGIGRRIGVRTEERKEGGYVKDEGPWLSDNSKIL